MAVELNNPDRYIDLAKWFETREPVTYCDWEGFADADAVMKATEAVSSQYEEHADVYKKETLAFAKTMTLHFVYTRTDVYQLPNEDEIRAVYEHMLEMAGCRYWMKETAT